MSCSGIGLKLFLSTWVFSDENIGYYRVPKVREKSGEK